MKSATPARAPAAQPAEAGGPADGRVPGSLFAVVTVLPALLAVAWLLAAVPLAAAGHFTPATVLPAALALAAVLLPPALGPARRALAHRDRIIRSSRSGWWCLGGTVAIAVAFAGYAAAFHDTQVMVFRDPGTYAQSGYWLAHHHALTGAAPTSAQFGGAVPLLSLRSAGFFLVNGQIVPQFMTGWPTVLAAGYWAGGWSGLLLMPALVGACGVLAVGGLAARLIGPRWAPLAALLAALCSPIQHASTTTLSESLSLVVITGAASILIDAFRYTHRTDDADLDDADADETDADETDAAVAAAALPLRSIRRYAFVGGLALGCTELVRLDGGVVVAALLPALAYLWATRRPGFWPAAAGLALSGALGVYDCAKVTRPYVVDNWASVKLMLVLLVLSAAASTAGALVYRGVLDRPDRIVRLTRLPWTRRLPAAGAWCVALLGVFFALRPYLETVRQATASYSYIEAAQQAQNLPVDPARTYAEQSLRWLSWSVGWPLLAAALLGAVVLTRRVLQGRDRAWIPALLLYVGTSALDLYDPAITPDHPWADRRLVDVVYPGVILLAVAGTRFAAQALRRRALLPALPARLRPAAIGVLCTALIVPTLAGGLPLATQRTGLGELAATNTLCNDLRTKDGDVSVVLVGVGVQIYYATVREQCGVPVALLPAGAAKKVLDEAVADIRAVGRTPVLLSRVPEALTGYGYSNPGEVVNVLTRSDEELLAGRPDGTAPLPIQIYLSWL